MYIRPPRGKIIVMINQMVNTVVIPAPSFKTKNHIESEKHTNDRISDDAITLPITDRWLT